MRVGHRSLQGCDGVAGVSEFFTKFTKLTLHSYSIALGFHVVITNALLGHVALAGLANRGDAIVGGVNSLKERSCGEDGTGRGV